MGAGPGVREGGFGAVGTYTHLDTRKLEQCFRTLRLICLQHYVE